jgi:Zn-finger nucleic acid-binding protein
MKRLCPKTGDELTPLARGAYKCSSCGGMFVPRLAVELVSEESAAPAAAPNELDGTGGRCPLDRSILIRAEIDMGDGRPVIFLERCGTCHGVWFDAGEWSGLAERHLLENIDDFWTAEWRTSLRQRRDQETHDRRLAEAFGAELFEELKVIAWKLRGHERRSQALAFIREASEN